MADKAIGELEAVKVGSLPLAPDIYDDTKIPVEQQGTAKHMTGRQFKDYGIAAAKEQAEASAASAQAAKASEDAAAKSEENAKASEDAARASQGAAANSASAALASQKAAAQSEQNAAKSAEASGESASASEASAQRSEAAAETAARDAAEKAVEDAQALLEGYVSDTTANKNAAETAAQDAKASESAAKSSQHAAKASEDNAAGSATAAAGSARDAASSAQTAQSAKTGAVEAREAAEAARDAAESHSTEAGTSAEEAAESAQGAAADADRAETAAQSAQSAKSAADASAQAADGSAQAAAASQTAAKSSEDNAKKSASNAKTSEDAAKAAQTAAEGARDEAQDYSDSAGESADSAEASAQKAVQYSGHPPKPQNGTWWTWNADSDTYVDTGVKSVLSIDKSYPSEAAMNADLANVPVNTLAIIASDVEQEENSRLYLRGESSWKYLGDLSGKQGITGPQGEAAGFGTVTATVKDGVGVPGVTVSATGPNSAKNITFAFTDLKGATGAKGDRGETGPAGAAAGFGKPTATVGTSTGTPSVSVTASGEDTKKVFSFEFDGLKGETGPAGPAGPKGAAGAKGDAGDTWVPTVSSTGDLSWAKNTGVTPSAVNIKGPKGDKGADGAAGAPGAKGNTGTRGSQWFSGTALTTTGTTTQQLTTGSYIVGDYYLNTSTGQVYRCTAVSGTTSTWTPQGSIRGATGAAGAAGKQGAEGPNTVSTSTTTNIIGLLKGSGSKVAAAVDGTDYLSPTTGDKKYLKLTGGTLTGDLTLSGAQRAIKYASGTRTSSPITFYQGDVNGSGIVIGDGGRVIIGSGESASGLHTELGTGTAKEAAEEMHIGGDAKVYVHTNCQTIESRKVFTFDTDGSLTAPGGFKGSLTGNAATATKLAAKRTFPAVALGSTASASFDGSANPTALGVSGTLPVSHGGTGQTAVDSAPASGSAKMVTSGGVYTALAAKAAKPTVVKLTLSATWTGNAQTVSCAGIVADESKQVVNIAPAVASFKAYMDAGIYVSKVEAGKLTFACGTAPTETLTVYVSVQNV